MNNQAIGVFDSGIGGLTIMREIRRMMPNEDILYLADQAHVPYGLRSITQVRSLSVSIVEFLQSQGAKAVVVACNTASAAALNHLRDKFQDVPIVGMEPAVKPAVGMTQTGHIGVLATPVTFEGELYASVVERFAEDVEVHATPIPGLVDLIEAGTWEGRAVEDLLSPRVVPLLDAGVDTLVLACTHYPFVIPALRAVVGPQIEIIDPAPAIARQTRRVLDELDLSADNLRAGRNTFYTSGDPQRFSTVIHRLFAEPGELHRLRWQEDQVTLAR